MTITSIAAKNRNPTVYRDIDLNFLPNPGTGDVGFLVNNRAIIESVKRLIFTNFYERLFHPEIGSGVQADLFENNTSMVDKLLQDDITECLNNWEPRINVISVTVVQDQTNLNMVNITLTCSFVGLPQATGQTQNISILLERVR